MKKFYLIICCFFISFYIKAEENYIVEVHGTIKEVNTHNYTETDNLKFLTIDGTFSDGNYTFDTNGNVSGLGTISSGAITSSGILTSATGSKIGDSDNYYYIATLNV